MTTPQFYVIDSNGLIVNRFGKRKYAKRFIAANSSTELFVESRIKSPKSLSKSTYSPLIQTLFNISQGELNATL